MAALPRSNWLRKFPSTGCRPRGISRRRLLGEALEDRRVLESTVVLNELMYYPAGDNSALEWIELYNQMSVDMDVTGWSLSGGVDFTFTSPTIIPRGGYVVVAASPTALQAASGLSGTFGPYVGQLSNGGETIELRDNNARIMDSVSYGDDGLWTPGADGSGASLAKLRPNIAADDPTSWTFSQQVGGTPGSANFPPPGAEPPVLETLLSGGAAARVLVPTQPADIPGNWNTLAYNDQVGGWFDRNVGVGYGSGAVAPLIDPNGGIGPQMSGINASAFVRLPFEVDDPDDLEKLFFNLDFDDGFVAYLNGTEIARQNAPGGIPAYNASAAQPVGSTTYTAGLDLATLEQASAAGANPNGAWSYGAKLSLGGALIAYPGAGGAHTNDYMQNGSPLQGYSGPPLQLPILVVNTSNANYSPCCGFSIAPKTIFMHPGVTNTSTFDVVRWTAPYAGTVTITNASFVQKGSKRAPEYVLHNNEIIASGYGTFTPNVGTVAVAAGDTIEFVVGPDIGGADNTGAADDPNGSRSVQFDAKITLTSGRVELDVSNCLNLLNSGTNVLAIQGLNTAAADADFVLRPQLIAQLKPVEPVPIGDLVVNEVAGTSGSFFVEIANRGSTTVDLAGYSLSTLGLTSAEHVFAAQSLAPGGLVVVNAAQLAGYTPAAGDRVFLFAPGETQLLDAVTVRDAARGRVAERDGQLAFVSTTTPGSANIANFYNAIVINEIMYHHQPQWSSGPVSAVDSSEEWIELYNRGVQTVSLAGWRLDDNIDYAFPVGTVLAPGQYLVVARDAVALRAIYPNPAITILGNFSGSLPNIGGTIVLKDGVGNIADEVSYLDDGRWPKAADGEGSSLELRDPDADNSLGEAWAASDESSKAGWQTYSYTGIATVNAGPVKWNEFVLGLLGAGEVLLDDIHVYESPNGANTELIQNSTFETLNKWRVLGNHHGSIVTDPANGANQVLRLVADGPSEAMFNHAETTLAGNVAIVAGREYQITFRAKWISGSPQVNTRLYFNWLPKTTIIEVGQLNGTPGAANSRQQSNIGPQFDNLVQNPIVPAANQAVTVSVEITDADAVASALLSWKPDGGAWSNVTMTLGSDGRYQGEIPGQASGKIVQFYVQATDGLGAVATYPAAGVDSRALYKVQDAIVSSTGLHTVQIIMTSADATLLHTNTNIMSNDLIGATVIYDNTEICHNVGVRLKGSMYGRSLAERIGYVVEFPPDRLFRGEQSQIALDRSGIGQVGVGGHEEIVAQQFLHHAGGIPAEYSDLVQMIAPLPQYNHTAIMGMSRLGDDYLDSQFEDGADGTQFDLELFYYTTTTTNGNPESLKTWSAGPYIQNEIKDYGPDKEQYRNQFLIKNNRDEDDYQTLMQVAQAFSLTGTPLKTATDSLLDIDQWMRVFASQSLLGNLDIYSIGLPHNVFLYVRPEDGKVLAMPHDLDQAFYIATNSAVFGTGNLAKITSIPANRRLFFGHLQDMIATTYNTAYMSQWTSHYSGLVNQNYSGVLNYIAARGNYITSQLPASVPFRITTNNGADFETSAASVTIAGDAWINVKQIFIEGRSQPLELTWTDLDSWQTTVSLVSGEHTLKFQAYNFQGQLLTFDTITINSTAAPYTQFDNLRITELMYNPTATAADAPFTSTDFEYIELQNIGSQPLELSGARLGGGVTFNFSPLLLAPGARVLVVNNAAAMAQRYGAGLNIAGEFSGNLNNSGEPITLEDSLGQSILNFSYSPDWVLATNGGGPSLAIRNAAGPASNWTSAAGWRASSSSSGSPGLAEPAASVAARQMFYNQSKFDGDSGAAGAADDGAIALDKTALLPGATATVANYSNYSRGINGIMVDVAALALPLTASDFAFRIGNDNNPAGWAIAPAPAISVRTGAGVNGSDRVTLIWPDGSIKNQWLQVSVVGAGLAASDVFYFGNAVGESGNNATDAIVNSTDELAARNNPRTFLNPAGVTNANDYNRDGLVNATDQILARANSTTLANSLKLISVPAAAQAAAGVIASDSLEASIADVAQLTAAKFSLPPHTPGRQPGLADSLQQVSVATVQAAAAEGELPAPLQLRDQFDALPAHTGELELDEDLFELVAAELVQCRM